MRQWKYRKYQTQYLANADPWDEKEFHDLAEENDASFACQIDDIINRSYARPFTTKADARKAGYKPCRYCMPDKDK